MTVTAPAGKAGQLITLHRLITHNTATAVHFLDEDDNPVLFYLLLQGVFFILTDCELNFIHATCTTQVVVTFATQWFGVSRL
jgi:hypothetical protein